MFAWFKHLFASKTTVFHTRRPMTEDEIVQFDSIFEKVDEVFVEVDKMFDMARRKK